MAAFRLRLLPRVMIGLAAVALLPLAIAPFIIDLNRDAMTSQVLRTHAVAARSAAARVEAVIASVRGPAEALAKNPLLAADPRGAAARNLLAGVLQAQPDLAGVAILAADGEEAIRVQSRARAELVSQSLEAVKDGPLAFVSTDGGDALRFDAAIPGDRGLRVRVVAEASPLSTVMQPEELGQEADMLLSDGRGNVVAASRAGVTLETFPRELVEAGRLGRASGAARAAEGRVLGAFAPVPGTGWFVLSRQPAEVAEALARDVRRQLFLAVGAALCLAVAISALAWRFLVRPLREMARAQRRLAGFSSGAARPGTEIGELRDALSMLERQIKDREAIGAVFVGRYQVVSFLGAGAMGSVFRGWDPKLQRPVALKTIRLHEEERFARESVSQLLHEAVMAARFSHPNIVAVYDVEERRRRRSSRSSSWTGPASSATCATARCRRPRWSRWGSRSRAAWPRRTRTAWCTGTSSQATCCWAATAPSRSPTSGSRAPSPPRATPRASSARPGTCRPRS
jgi:hypothetical protein